MEKSGHSESGGGGVRGVGLCVTCAWCSELPTQGAAACRAAHTRRRGVSAAEPPPPEGGAVIPPGATEATKEEELSPPTPHLLLRVHSQANLRSGGETPERVGAPPRKPEGSEGSQHSDTASTPRISSHPPAEEFRLLSHSQSRVDTGRSKEGSSTCCRLWPRAGPGRGVGHRRLNLTTAYRGLGLPRGQ
uniref:Uncharacterized protein n=1 Tax=Myotis myotis TaxID=51298 RepID=A0A7J7VHY2_MYOMY|nr:hypothetical protein mMyoMyo1_008239 [Myotis myotis]